MKQRSAEILAGFLGMIFALGGCAQDVGSESNQSGSSQSRAIAVDVDLPLLQSKEKKQTDLRKLVVKFNELREQEIRNRENNAEQSSLLSVISGGIQVWLLRLTEADPVRPPRLWVVSEERRQIWGYLAQAVSWSVVELNSGKNSPPTLECSLALYTHGTLKAVDVSVLRQGQPTGYAGFDASTISSRRDFFAWANIHAANLCSLGVDVAEVTRLSEMMDEFRAGLLAGKTGQLQGFLDNEILADLKEVVAAAPSSTQAMTALLP